MSRVGKQPILLPSDVTISINDGNITVKGKKDSLSLNIHSSVLVEQDEGKLSIRPRKESTESWTMCGTMRALLNNMVIGVTKGFSKRLQLVGVGYRAQLQGNKVILSLGYSHPIEFLIPKGVNIELPSQTEIVVSGADKQLVGETAATIRSYRSPEPYKGKGVRYADEIISLKEAKKK